MSKVWFAYVASLTVALSAGCGARASEAGTGGSAAGTGGTASGSGGATSGSGGSTTGSGGTTAGTGGSGGGTSGIGGASSGSGGAATGGTSSSSGGQGGRITASGGGTGPGGGAGRGGAGGRGGTNNPGSGGSAGGSGGGTILTKCAGPAPSAGVFYVDAEAGKDANEGSTPALAWQTLGKVSATTFAAGSAVCFKAGGTWTGQLAPKGSGSAAAPNVIDQYGSGSKPRITAAASVADAVLLLNVQYWDLNNLEVVNKQSAPGDYRGIAVRGKDAGTLNHLYVRNCFVHDVTGVVNWVGGDVADNQPPWVTFETGWDASKRTGGIVVEVQSDSGTKTQFNDVVIENNVVQDTSFGGIVVKQFDGGYGWGVRASKTDDKFLPHTNVVIRGNYVSQTNTSYGCNALYVTGTQHGLVEQNVTKDAGTSAIEINSSDDVRVQYNETFRTVRKAGGADYNGIDADKATTGVIIQYNYIHDNGDGILLCQIAFGDSVVRYNLLVNNSRHGINLHSSSSATNQTYNNLIFIDGPASANLINTSGSSTELAAAYTIRNNILHSARAAAVTVTGGGVSYANNLFSGIPGVGTAAQTGSPLFVDGTARPSGDATGPALSRLTGFQVRAGSPAIDHGAAITNNGGVDFWGTPLYVRTADIGPFEAP